MPLNCQVHIKLSLNGEPESNTGKNIKFLGIWNYSNSQTLNLKYKYGSRKNQVLQEKLQPSKKTVLRTKLRENFLKKKTNVQNCRKKLTLQKKTIKNFLMNFNLINSNFFKWEGWSDCPSHRTGTTMGGRESYSSIWRKRKSNRPRT